MWYVTSYCISWCHIALFCITVSEVDETQQHMTKRNKLLVIQNFVIQYLLDAVVIADNLELLILVPSW